MKMKDAELESWQALWSGDEGPVAPVLDARRIAAQGRAGSFGGWRSRLSWRSPGSWSPSP